jgi:hypothetical protein
MMTGSGPVSNKMAQTTDEFGAVVMNVILQG